MEQTGIYQDIAKRTQGDIYIGVVGPVRTGKSSFIKMFMEKLVLPHIEGDWRRQRAQDELPQSSAGRTIMTTEPKFIPEDAVTIQLDDAVSLNVRLIDCVGYVVPSAMGYIENDQPRMVNTPWYQEQVPFPAAAEIGTRKVIAEHSTIGLVVTTDGSISDIPREEYQEAEERVIRELGELDKPFAVLLNCRQPQSAPAQALRAELEERYGVPVQAVNCLELEEADIRSILGQVLSQFPLQEVQVNLPQWILSLPQGHWLRQAVFGALLEAGEGCTKLRQVPQLCSRLADCEQISGSFLRQVDAGTGSAKVDLTVDQKLFYKILGETTGLAIEDESQLMPCLSELAQVKAKYDKVRGALEEVEVTGYGIVMPGLEELTLDEPEIVKQGGRYGVRLRASAPSIHMMRADITTEVSPIVGSEKQSEELVLYLLKEFEENPAKIWESNIFGKSLHELVNEGLHNKLYRMPAEARLKLQETIERMINEGCAGLICLIL